MKGLEISSHTWGMTSTWEGHAFVSPQGQACPVKIKTHGPGKYSTGYNRIYTDDYTQGVYRVDIWNGEIEITYYPPEGGKERIRPVLAPEPVQKFAVVFAEKANCYHCKCLDNHLEAASRLSQVKETSLITA